MIIRHVKNPANNSNIHNLPTLLCSALCNQVLFFFEGYHQHSVFFWLGPDVWKKLQEQLVLNFSWWSQIHPKSFVRQFFGKPGNGKHFARAANSGALWIFMDNFALS